MKPEQIEAAVEIIIFERRTVNFVRVRYKSGFPFCIHHTDSGVLDTSFDI